VSRRGNLAFDLSDNVDEVLEGVRRFVDAEVIPRHEQAAKVLDDPRARFDAAGLFSPEVLDLIREIRMASAAAGYYTMFVPEAIGGGGLGSEALYRVWEELYHRYGPRYWLMAWVVAHWARGPSHVLVHATPQARTRVLPGLLSGQTSMCFAMSEPDAGSDARMMRTRAVADGDDWIVSGSKIWISNGPYAEYAVVFARVEGPAEGATTGRISAFLVPTDSPGFSAEGSIKMFGEVGGDESLLHFDAVRVGADMVLGPIGGGFSIAMSGVTSGRLYNSARAVGLARWALETATDYVKGRHAFGRPVAEHQGVAFPLAESAMEIHAAHLMGLNCALVLDSGGQATKELSMAKAFSTEAAVRAIDRAIQAHGAIGFTNELGLVEAFHAVRKACVADGTSEILRRAIAARLFGGDLDL
jgi:acyl-CoA dehydrogenase